METLCDDYFADYQMRVDPKRLTEDLLTAKLIREVQGNYSFKYGYYYHFFVARYFRDNLQESSQGKSLREKLEEMADRVYSVAYANIVFFYLYLTKDIPLIERILGNAERVYSSYNPATLEGDAQFINGLYVSAPKPVLLPGTDVEENRDYVREQMDAAEHNRPDAIVDEKVPYDDTLNDFIKINIALKTIQILGQVLRNFPGSLRRDVKVRIAEQCYLLGLRVVSFVLTAVKQNEDELRRYYGLLMKQRQPTLSPSRLGQSAEEAIIVLVEFWAYSMIKTLSYAVGMEELAETYKEVVKRHQEMLSVQMIDASIKLDHFWIFPESHVDDLCVRTRKNRLGLAVLRLLVANHFYLYKTPHAIRQKYSARFDINVREVKLIEGGLAKSREA